MQRQTGAVPLLWKDRPAARCGERPGQTGCGAAIRWVIWPETRKRMPVDAQPSLAGDIVVDHDGNARKLARDEAAAGRATYVSHFATCPVAASFHKARKPGRP